MPPAWQLALGGTALVGVVGLGWLATRVHTTRSNERLVRTGLGIVDLQVGRTFVRLPWQYVRHVSTDATVFDVQVSAMSEEKLKFSAPATWTIAVGDSDEAVATFSRRFAEDAEGRAWRSVVQAALVGHTRALAARTPIEDVFSERAKFAADVQDSIAQFLAEYGLRVLNVTMRELLDVPGCEYFGPLSEKVTATARNKATAEVAAADRDGAVAAKARKTEERMSVAKLEADARTAEGERDKRVLAIDSEVAVRKAETALLAATARIEGEQRAAQLQEERERAVQVARAAKQTEAERVAKLAPATVAAEAAVATAEGDAKRVTIAAGAALEAARAAADGVAYAGDAAARAALAMLDAQAAGLGRIVAACNGDAGAAVSYVMVDRGVWEKLAAAQGAAVAGMKPNINVWSTGGASGDAGGALATPLRELASAMPPFFNAIEQQTGLRLPALMEQLARGGGDAGSSHPEAAAGAAVAAVKAKVSPKPQLR